MVVVSFEDARRKERRRFVGLVLSASVAAFVGVFAIGAGWGQISAASQWALNAGLSVASTLEASIAGTVVDDVDPAEVVTAPEEVFAVAKPQRKQQRVNQAFPLCKGGKRVTCVVDGDTFWLEGQKVRIADIDMPEIGSLQCAKELALGEKAKHRLQSLLSAGPFEMHALSDRDTDQYGRSLRILIRNGQSLGDRLVAEGLARTWEGQRKPWCGT
nr:thermonuclease family protein [Shinella yambaruensis]